MIDMMETVLEAKMRELLTVSRQLHEQIERCSSQGAFEIGRASCRERVCVPV